MALFAKDRPSLHIRNGPCAGKRLVLRQDELLMGSAKSCRLPLKGPGIAAEHAKLRLREGVRWELSDLASGTFVNQVPISRKIVRCGDVIRLGDELLLEFVHPAERALVTAPRPAQDPAAAAEPPKQKTGVNKWLAIGIGLWYLVAAIGFGLLGRLDLVQTPIPALSAEAVGEALEDTRGWLGRRRPAPAEGMPFCTALDPRSEAAHDYYALNCRGAGLNGNAGVIGAVRRDLLLERLQRLFDNAWHKEQQQRWSAAREDYQRIVSLIPDLRSPATRLASARIIELDELIDGDIDGRDRKGRF